jgi:hypothetical protein
LEEGVHSPAKAQAIYRGVIYELGGRPEVTVAHDVVAFEQRGSIAGDHKRFVIDRGSPSFCGGAPPHAPDVRSSADSPPAQMGTRSTLIESGENAIASCLNHFERPVMWHADSFVNQIGGAARI